MSRVLVFLIKHAVEHEHAHYKEEESKFACQKDDDYKVNEKKFQRESGV